MEHVNRLTSRLLGDDDPDSPHLPPGLPPTKEFTGPWLTTQLELSCAIGLFSFIVFSYCRTRWPVLFAPRTKLKGFSPHEAHTPLSFFAWILPTIRTSEFTILQIVGLDAAVLLNFLKMSFYLFTSASVLVLCILMPVNYHNNDVLGDDDDDTGKFRRLAEPAFPIPDDWLDLLNDANSIHTLHLLFTYVFTGLALRFIYINYEQHIRSRQLFCLQLVHSVPARTVMITDLPNHLRGEHALAMHFEKMDLPVESVSLCRELGRLQSLIERRTDTLLKLEAAWTKYVGNPSSVEEYDPSMNVRSDPSTAQLVDAGDEEAQRVRLVVPHRSRPTIRTSWFGKKHDALEYLAAQFKAADEAVLRERRSAKLQSTGTAFVTFETMSSAQIAAQVVASTGSACLAPEPRDVVWSNMTHTKWNLRIRQVLVFTFLVLLFLFWLVPVSTLASLLSYEEIKKAAPWLGRFIDLSPRLRSLIQTSLPSFAVIALNGLLPFLLEALSYTEGLKARSWVEYALLKKYFLFLVINVVFIFLVASTYWALVRDLANSPAKVPEKLAQALKRGVAKRFFVCYIILQGLGVMPLQLLNLGVIIPRFIARIFWVRTPREYAEVNAPPMLNYGAVYPQAILVFVITLTYSVIQPLIVIFGAIYFGIAYVVYKYKLLFVFYKPYESHGEAWPITFNRLMWGVVMFHLFMIGIFTLSKSFVLSTLMLPLLLFTIYWTWYMNREYKPLGHYVNLDFVYEAQRGGMDEVSRLQAGEHVSNSHTHLNRRRYAQNDETLYVAPEETRTDYSQPPMTNFYYGILNTGKRRYGHPALNGILPQPWLPLKKGQTLANYNDNDGDNGDVLAKTGDTSTQAVVLTLRRKYSVMRNDVRHIAGRFMGHRKKLTTESGEEVAPPGDTGIPQADTPKPPSESGSNPWRDVRPGPSRPVPSGSNSRRFSFDHATGVINLSDDDGHWIPENGHDDNDSDSDEIMAPSPPEAADGVESGVPVESGRVGRRHSTYWHHPERRRLSGTPID